MLLFALLEHVALQRALSAQIFLLVLLRVVTQVAPHLLLLGLTQEGGRPWSPKQLVELVVLDVSEGAAMRRPQVVPILHLVPPVRYGRGDKPADIEWFTPSVL